MSVERIPPPTHTRDTASSSQSQCVRSALLARLCLPECEEGLQALQGRGDLLRQLGCSRRYSHARQTLDLTAQLRKRPPRPLHVSTQRGVCERLVADRCSHVADGDPPAAVEMPEQCRSDEQTVQIPLQGVSRGLQDVAPAAAELCAQHVQLLLQVRRVECQQTRGVDDAEAGPLRTAQPQVQQRLQPGSQRLGAVEQDLGRVPCHSVQLLDAELAGALEPVKDIPRVHDADVEHQQRVGLDQGGEVGLVDAGLEGQQLAQVGEVHSGSFRVPGEQLWPLNQDLACLFGRDLWDGAEDVRPPPPPLAAWRVRLSRRRPK